MNINEILKQYYENHEADFEASVQNYISQGKTREAAEKLASMDQDEEAHNRLQQSELSYKKWGQ